MVKVVGVVEMEWVKQVNTGRVVNNLRFYNTKIYT